MDPSLAWRWEEVPYLRWHSLGIRPWPQCVLVGDRQGVGARASAAVHRHCGLRPHPIIVRGYLNCDGGGSYRQ